MKAFVMLFSYLATLIATGVVGAHASSHGEFQSGTKRTTRQNSDGLSNRQDTTMDAHNRAVTACNMAYTILGGGNITRTYSSEAEVPLFVDPSSPVYASRTISHWSDNCWQNASCIISPSKAQEVAQLLAIVAATNATFSIRSGGHDFNVGHSSVGMQGLLIDMVNFDSISLHPDKSAVTVGPGVRWGAVYDSLNGTGVSVNGARSPNPAVAGQTLGGGIGWLTGKAGPTAASLVAADVVLANGSILSADETHNSDLLWALRGGGPNYGVVTSLTYRTLPIDKIWFAANLYPREKNQELLDALVEYQQLASDDSNASIVYQLSENNATAQSFVGFLYLDPSVEWPAVFNPFYAVGNASTLINSTVGTVADLSSRYFSPQYPDPGTHPTRHYVVSLPHKIDNQTYQESYSVFKDLAGQALARGWNMNYGSQPITATAAGESEDTPLNLTLVDQDWVHVTIDWSSASDDSEAMSLLDQMGQSIADFASRNNAELSYRFMNDANSGQRVLSSYGVGMFERLWVISCKYDPGRIFQRLQHGGWLLHLGDGAADCTI